MAQKKENKKVAKQFVIFGIGRFGFTLANRLTELGHEVVAIDVDENIVNQTAPFVTHSLIADATDEQVLQGLDITSFDAAIVSIGSLEPNILTTFKLQKLGVKRIISRALHTLHAEILTMIGATSVVFPEKDMAIRLAYSLNSSTIVEFLELAPDFSMIEVKLPPDLVGVEIRNSQFRNQYSATIVAVERDGERVISPSGTFKFKENDLLYVIGDTQALENLADVIVEH
jgi:trk system potassium uptake protein TrkA